MVGYKPSQSSGPEEVLIGSKDYCRGSLAPLFMHSFHQRCTEHLQRAGSMRDTVCL